mgnify:CR=1 FL=1
MEIKLLEELGLTKNEVKVYLSLLESGTTSAGILIKKLGMHRAAVYDLIDMLIEKGLVSYVIKSNRKYFQAEDPNRLLEYLDIKKQNLIKEEVELKRFIPQLLSIRKLSKEEQEGSIYKGKKGLKSIFEDILREKKPWYVFGATGKFKEIFNAYFIHFHDRRVKLNIPLKVIFNEKIRNEKRKLKLATIRYLPESYITPSTTYIYGNKIAVIIWSDEPMAFLIRSKQVSDSYKSFFELLWNLSKI